MRSLLTWALVSALALIALAALTDALRASAEPAASPARVEPPPPRPPCAQAVLTMFLGEGGTTPCARVMPRRLGV
jgi:hypothetical protein